MSEVLGIKFQNGDNCKGISFVSPDGTFELDIIDIQDEYPEGTLGEVWAKNEQSHLLATLISGAGRIAVRRVVEDEVSVEITELSSESAVNVPAGTWYAWQSDADAPLKTAATFVPPFNPNYYSVNTEHKLQRFASLRQVVNDHLDQFGRLFFKDYRDFDDALEYVYGQLIDDDKDPDAILSEYGVTETGETN